MTWWPTNEPAICDVVRNPEFPPTLTTFFSHKALSRNNLNNKEYEQVVLLPCVVACFHSFWICTYRQANFFEDCYSTRSRTYHGYLLIHQGMFFLARKELTS